jgi:Ca2+-binding EF-hand superfamily protein
MGAGASVDATLTERLAAVFKVIDRDENGFIVVKEIQEFITESGMSGGAAAISAQRWFDTVNSNFDGKVITLNPASGSLKS